MEKKIKIKPLIVSVILISVISIIHWIGIFIYDKFLQVNENANVEEMLNSSSDAEYAIARFQAMGGYLNVFTNIIIVIGIFIIVAGIYKFIKINKFFIRGEK